jgi:ribosomal protein S18 acetylase RimI-like enzyme
MTAILDALREAGTTGRVRLAVNEDQAAAMALYQHSGFTPYEVKEARMGDGQMHREVCMSRKP